MQPLIGICIAQVSAAAQNHLGPVRGDRATLSFALPRSQRGLKPRLSGWRRAVYDVCERIARVCHACGRDEQSGRVVIRMKIHCRRCHDQVGLEFGQQTPNRGDDFEGVCAGEPRESLIWKPEKSRAMGRQTEDREGLAGLVAPNRGVASAVILAEVPAAEQRAMRPRIVLAVGEKGDTSLRARGGEPNEKSSRGDRFVVRMRSKNDDASRRSHQGNNICDAS